MKYIYTLIVSIIIVQSLQAQINQYWMTQVGARSTMLGGAVVGYVRDNSSIYYNPAGMAFIDISSLSATGDAVYGDFNNMENGAGDGVDLYNWSLHTVPHALSGVIKNKKRPWMTVNYSILNNGISTTYLTSKHTGVTDALPSNPGKEQHYSILDFYNTTREDMLGFGSGYKIKENFALGISVFVPFRQQTNRLQYDINIMDNSFDNANILAYNSYYSNLQSFNVALMFKIGLAYEFEKLKLGGNITTPRIPLYYFTSTTLDRKQEIYIPGATSYSVKKSYMQDGLSNRYKTPFIFDFGAMYTLSSKTQLYFTVGLFTAVDKYNILKEEELTDSIDIKMLHDDSDFAKVEIANKRLVNFAVGMETRINRNLTLLMGFHTDFNNLDTEKIDVQYDNTPATNQLDIYHLSGGFDWKSDKVRLNLGFITAYGRKNNITQMVDLTSPSIDNMLLGDLSDNVTSSYVRFGFILGFTYFFFNE